MPITFPLQSAPTCLHCSRVCMRGITSERNRNGNAGRTYYFCNNTNHGRKFACWDDDRGIESGNPECDCGHIGRMFMADGDQYYGCPVGTCSWTMHSSCLCSEYPNDDGDDEALARQPVEIRVPDDIDCKVTTEPGESPLCTICRLVLERLRRPQDCVTTFVPPEERSRLGCHLCTLFLRYTQRSSDLGEEEELPDHYIRYEYDEMDLDQANLFMLRYDLRKSYVGHKWLTQSALGCIPSAGERGDNALWYGNTKHK
jgi:hypothetical protein